MDERDRSMNMLYGDFGTDSDELMARRDFMLGRGYRFCDIMACNCNSWHRGHAEDRLSDIRDLLNEMDVPTNGVTLIDAIRNAIAAKETSE